MKDILMAVLLSAFVWPGAGQIYNKEYKKGLTLIGLTLMFGVSLLMGVGMDVVRNLPPDLSTFNRSQAEALTTRLMVEHGSFYLTFQLLMMAAWLFSVADAYMTARDKHKPLKPQ